MKFWFKILLAIAWLTTFAVSSTQADVAAGRDKSFTCTGCHSSPGYRNAYPGYNVPKIGGQKADYIESALKAYRDSTRQHSTMHAQIAQMSDEDIADIAEYFSTMVKQ